MTLTPGEVDIVVDVRDENDESLKPDGPITEWLRAFHAAIDSARRKYRAQRPLGEARIWVEVDPHNTHGDDGMPTLEIELRGVRRETPAEAQERWRRTEEGAREWDRRRKEDKEQEERAELARLRAKYTDG